MIKIKFTLKKIKKGENYELIYNELNQIKEIKLNNVTIATYTYDENGNVYKLSMFFCQLPKAACNGTHTTTAAVRFSRQACQKKYRQKT